MTAREVLDYHLQSALPDSMDPWKRFAESSDKLVAYLESVPEHPVRLMDEFEINSVLEKTLELVPETWNRIHVLLGAVIFLQDQFGDLIGKRNLRYLRYGQVVLANLAHSV